MQLPHTGISLNGSKRSEGEKKIVNWNSSNSFLFRCVSHFVRSFAHFIYIVMLLLYYHHRTFGCFVCTLLPLPLLHSFRFIRKARERGRETERYAQLKRNAAHEYSVANKFIQSDTKRSVQMITKPKKEIYISRNSVPKKKKKKMKIVSIIAKQPSIYVHSWNEKREKNNSSLSYT